MTKITKTALVEQLAQDTGLSKKDADKAVGSLVKLMAGHLRSGAAVGIPGLGTFSVKATAARTGVKPGTSEKIQIPAGKKVSFKVADDLKKSL
ncbi:HU family DNA-binding protein [Deinococcus wulumuqiensis]|uniref:HU family DNA-binding protein n=1 Tax=Deinococcus wulumuqiensis TaxID=980427 RepID=UPI00311A14AE